MPRLAPCYTIAEASQKGLKALMPCFHAMSVLPRKHPKRDWKFVLAFTNIPWNILWSIPKGIESPRGANPTVIDKYIEASQKGLKVNRFAEVFRSNIFEKHPKRDWKYQTDRVQSAMSQGKHPKRDWKELLAMLGVLMKPGSIPKGIERNIKTLVLLTQGKSKGSIPKGIERFEDDNNYDKVVKMKHPKRDWKR